MSKNIQILLETMTRCGGNCSGCALASTERMLKSEFDFTGFKNNAKKINQLLSHYEKDQGTPESITLFLGQGDHFLMNDEDIEPFVEICAQLVPQHLQCKTVIFITASAIGKEEVIKTKMDKFYDLSVSHGIPFFIQTVFDPKKIILHDNFKDTYINNILYFKKKCGMTELTINLGQDMFEQMSPQDFHKWIIQYGFKHVEMNWVMNKLTHSMWTNHSKTMFSWIKEWLLEYKKDHQYEINFIPFMLRHFKMKDKQLLSSHPEIKSSLMENIYIDYMGNMIQGQMGIISNLTPLQERMSKEGSTANIHHFLSGKDIYQYLSQNAQKLSTVIQRQILKKISCLDCEYKTVCSLSASTTWFDYSDGQTQDCPWQIRDFLQFLEDNFFDVRYGQTIFDKNPVQSLSLLKENNELSDYFIEKMADISCSI